MPPKALAPPPRIPLPARFSTVFLLSTALLSSCATRPPLSSESTQPAPPPVDATVTMSGTLAGLGLGYGHGRGTLSYAGSTYSFCIHGVSVGDIGAADVKADGLVFHLPSLDAFPGKYLAISTGAALARGETAAVLKNERGVTMQVETQVKGVWVNMAASSIEIALAGTDGCR